MHQLGSNMTVRDYAAKVGMNEDTLGTRVQAARVVGHVADSWAGAFEGPPEAQMEALDNLRWSRLFPAGHQGRLRRL